MNVALRRKLFVVIIIAVVAGATVYGFFPKAADVDLVFVTRGPLQITIEEEGRTRLKERFVNHGADNWIHGAQFGPKLETKWRRGQSVIVLEPLHSAVLDARSRRKRKRLLTLPGRP